MTTATHDPITPEHLAYLPDRDLHLLAVTSAVQWDNCTRNLGLVDSAVFWGEVAGAATDLLNDRGTFDRETVEAHIEALVGHIEDLSVELTTRLRLTRDDE